MTTSKSTEGVSHSVRSIELPANSKSCIMFYVDHNSTKTKTTILIKALKTALAEYYEILEEPQIIVQSYNAKKAKLRVMSKIIKDGIVNIEQVKSADVICSLLDEQIKITWNASENATSYLIYELVNGTYLYVDSVTTNEFKCQISQGKHTYRIDATDGINTIQGVNFTFTI